MKSLLTVSGVVIAHICVFLVLVNGCRNTPQNYSEFQPADTSIFSGGARRPASGTTAPPAVAVSDEDVIGEGDAQKPVVGATADAPRDLVSAPAKKLGEKNIYTVRKGESLWIIAHRNGLTVQQLASANGIKLNAALHPGQKLEIPAPSPKTQPVVKATPTDGEIYVVKKGDYLGKIARKVGVSVKAIREANELKSDNIREGQKLVIPSKNAATPKGDESAKDVTVPPKKAEEPPAQARPAEVKTDDVPAQPTDPLAVPEGGFLRSSGGDTSGENESPTPAMGTAAE